MKRREVLSHLGQHGCRLIREGGRHSWWGNPANGKRSAVPRHTEISDQLCRKICKDLGVSPPCGAEEVPVATSSKVSSNWPVIEPRFVEFLASPPNKWLQLTVQLVAPLQEQGARQVARQLSLDVRRRS